MLSPLVMVARDQYIAQTVCPPLPSLRLRLVTAPFASPLCLLTTFFFTMLLFSPKTRNIVPSFFQTIERLGRHLIDNVSRLHPTTHTDAEVATIKAAYIAIIRKKNREITEFRQERDYAQQQRRKSDEEVTTLSEALMIAGAELEAMQEQLDEALNTDDKREIAALELKLASTDNEINDHKSEIKYLNVSLTQEKSSNNSNKERWQNLSGKYQDLKLAHSKELSTLKLTHANDLQALNLSHSNDLSTMSTQKQKQKLQYTINNLIMQSLPHKNLLDILFTLSEADGEHLTLAVAFARILQMKGVSLASLRIDEQRVDVLWEFVKAGQAEWCAVQPQRMERGFRAVGRSVGGAGGGGGVVAPVFGNYQQDCSDGATGGFSIFGAAKKENDGAGAVGGFSILGAAKNEVLG